MRNLVIIAGALMSLTLPSSVAAQDFDNPIAETISELQVLAEQGDADARFELGWLYQTGQGVTQDFNEAAKWYLMSVAKGHVGAQYNLGGLYLMGRGVTQDYVYAHMWLNIAASNGNGAARQNRDLVAERMTPSQIEDAQKLARECVQKNYQGCAK